MLRNSLWIFLILTACNNKLVIPKLVSIDPHFQPYVNDFIAEANKQSLPAVIDNISIHFTNNLTNEVLGQCTTFDFGTYGTPLILINDNDWNNETETTRHVMIYHELGHCFLWRVHTYTFNGPGGDVTSIMYPFIQNDSEYSTNWSYYMQELFHGWP